MYFWIFLLISLMAGRDPAGLVRSGNDLYHKGQFDQAIAEYEKALAENPNLYQAIFNKANAYYRLDDLAKAAELYQEVSARSKDMDLVKKAKYNLGNTHFQMGLRQRDSNLSKALEELRTSIGLWRAVLDIDPNYEPARRNKEVAGLIIKDILDQLNRKPPSDPNMTNPDQYNSQQQAGEPNQPAQIDQVNEPNQPQPDQEGQTQGPDQIPQDITAQQIIENERRQRSIRQMQLRGLHIPVEKDW